jgi:hypothetical protein
MTDPPTARLDRTERKEFSGVAAGEPVIKCPSPPNFIEDTYDPICYRARSDEYHHLMTDSPRARRVPGGEGPHGGSHEGALRDHVPGAAIGLALRNLAPKPR